MSVIIYHTAQCNIPEDNHHLENLESDNIHLKLAAVLSCKKPEVPVHFHSFLQCVNLVRRVKLNGKAESEKVSPVPKPYDMELPHFSQPGA